jgi:hypothetical protein
MLQVNFFRLNFQKVPLDMEANPANIVRARKSIHRRRTSSSFWASTLEPPVRERFSLTKEAESSHPARMSISPLHRRKMVGPNKTHSIGGAPVALR